MKCEGCGNLNAHRISYSSSGEKCDSCGAMDLNSFKFSDVFFKKPYFDPHIAHPENSPKGNYIHSRSHKAQLMKELRLSERGDKQHGSRDQY